jgi:hypothetical protein
MNERRRSSSVWFLSSAKCGEGFGRGETCGTHDGVEPGNVADDERSGDTPDHDPGGTSVGQYLLALRSIVARTLIATCCSTATGEYLRIPIVEHRACPVQYAIDAVRRSRCIPSVDRLHEHLARGRYSLSSRPELNQAVDRMLTRP